MEKLDQLTRLRTAVKSGNQELIDHALEEIKQKGDSSYIALLIEFLHHKLTGEVTEKIFQLFVDLKHQDSIDQLISEMRKEADLDILVRLVACCWQNGLNYSKHLSYFVDLVLEQEFQIAFEAFTVVENMYGKIEGDTEIKLIETIGSKLMEVEERKQYLLRGMLEIIPNIPLDQDPVDF